MGNKRYLLSIAVGIFLCWEFTSTSGDKVETASTQNITVEPQNIKSATGETIEVKCTTTLNDQDIFWISPNRTHINDFVEPSRFSVTNGTLTIKDLKEHDSGTYVCSVGQAVNASAVITAYIMPNYVTEGMIILGINGILLVIFFSCLAQSTIQNRRARAHYDKVTASKA